MNDENHNPEAGATWRQRHPFISGAASGIALSLIVSGGGIWLFQNFSAQHDAGTAAKRLDLMRPLIASANAAPVAGSEPSADSKPADLSADCEKFIADLQTLQKQTEEHLNTLRGSMTTAYLASRSSEIDLDALTAQAGDLKQDLADFQQTYARIDPLINAFTPEQINQLSEIKDQFAKYQRLSDRLDNTLAGITDYRNRLADSEAYATDSAFAAPATLTLSGSTGGDVISIVSSTTTQTTTSVVSQPGSVYTDSVYYYNTTPSISLWFGTGYYDPFWRTSYWPRYHNHTPPPPPRPPHPVAPAPRPPVTPPHRPDQPSRPPVPNNPSRPNTPPAWNQPKPDTPRPNTPPAWHQPKPDAPRPNTPPATPPARPVPAPNRPTATPPSPAPVRPAPSAPTPATTRIAPSPSAPTPVTTRIAPSPSAPTPATTRIAPSPSAPTPATTRVTPSPSAPASSAPARPAPPSNPPPSARREQPSNPPSPPPSQPSRPSFQPQRQNPPPQQKPDRPSQPPGNGFRHR